MAAGQKGTKDGMLVFDIGSGGEPGQYGQAMAVVTVNPATGDYAGGGGGGGGGGDASAANQATGNASLASIDTKASNIATMSAKLPASLGAKTTANAMAVSLATDDVQIGSKVTAVAALAAGGAGLIGWLSSIWAQLPASLGIKTAAASLSVAPASDAVFSLAQTAVRSAITVTRPANVTAYTAGDVVGGAITFTSLAASGGYLMLTGADLRYDVAAIPTGMTSFRLYLYDATPPSALADNAAFDLQAGDRAAYLGFVDIGSVADMGSTLCAQVDQLNKLLKQNASTSLFGYLVTNGGYTPAANSETLQVRLSGLAGV